MDGNGVASPETSTTVDPMRSTLGDLFKRLGDATSPLPDYFQLELNHLRRREEGELVTNYGNGGQYRPREVPLLLSFEELTYSVKSKNPRPITVDEVDGLSSSTSSYRRRITSKTPKTLLNLVSGKASQGEILAVLGASGSGKTTLIDALANRISKKSLEGRITLNGEVLESRVVKAISAYVMQQDLLYPMLTVEETLMFSAEFRLPGSVTTKQKWDRVRELIDQLELKAVASSRIGDEGHRGISGGERRRVSIGMDIIHDPLLLFLDEPTSGLDSTSAYNVVKVLQSIARSGSIVVTSIHQPSARILDLLDQLLFLSRGQAVYSGKPSGLQPFFSYFGRPIPENENHVEFALDIIRELEMPPNDVSPLVNFHKSWQRKASEQEQKKKQHQQQQNVGTPERSASLREAISASISRGKLISGRMTRDGTVATESVETNSSSSMPTFANPMWKEVWVLSRRAFTNSKRLPEVFVMRFLAVMVTGFFLASVFWQLDQSPAGVLERFGFFAIAMSTTYYISAEALTVFHLEQEIFMRETAYNGYRKSSYVISNAIVAIPSVLFLSVAFAITTFFAAGLDGGAEGFFFYLVTTFAAFWAGISFITFLSGIIPPGRMGFTVIMGILSYYLLVSGVFIARDRIPSYWLWLHYISLITYPYQAVLRNEFEDPNRCFMRGVQLFDNSPLNSFLTEEKKLSMLEGMGFVMGMNVTSDTCFEPGPVVLEQQGVLDLGKWQCVAVLFAWGLLFRGLFYLILLLGNKNKRK